MNSGDKHVPKDINLSSEIPDAPSEIIRKAAVRTLAAVPVRMMEFAEEIHPPIGEAITDFANTVSKKVGQLAGERPRVYSPAQAKNAVGLAITSASLAATAYAYSRSQEEEKKMRNEAQIGALLKQQGASDAKVGKLEATLGEVKATLGEVKAKQGEILEHLTKNPPSPPYRSPAEIIKEGLNKTEWTLYEQFAIAAMDCQYLGVAQVIHKRKVAMAKVQGILNILTNMLQYSWLIMMRGENLQKYMFPCKCTRTTY